MSEITHAAPSGVEHAKLLVFADCGVVGAGPPSPQWATARQPSLPAGLPSRSSVRSEGWWSQTGSNRRPHACKARALPAELWPQTGERSDRRSVIGPSSPYGLRRARFVFVSLRGCATRSRRRSVVGLGRLELPTSRLSSARSNQLSYKPLTPNSRFKDLRLRAGII
jgi:hypothetical protein